MERKGRICRHLLRLATLLAYLPFTYACISYADPAQVTIVFSRALAQTKSSAPEEEKISDISLMIFDESGNAEECMFLDKGISRISTTLVADKRYTFCACANFGRQIYADHIDELQELVFRMAYPDEYKEGIPLAAMQSLLITEDCSIEIALERLMAKISLSMDRSHLDEDVEMFVRAARIGNCPRYVKPFTDSRIRDKDDTFPVGFSLNDVQTSDLNINVEKDRSKEVSLYMFENMQGTADIHIGHDRDKVFDKGDPRKDICSYIEMEIEYLSSEKKSGSKGLVYRFYLGEDRNSFDVRRNTCYHITVTPENDGLSEDSWRVDQSDITDIGPSYFKAWPSSYIQGNIGDSVHIWCDFSPADAPFDVGASYMEDDKAEGIYDYVIDDDGHGAVLTLTGPGRGLIYMEAGAPVNDAALFIIEVNQP